jgi:hypothetical protein
MEGRKEGWRKDRESEHVTSESLKDAQTKTRAGFDIKETV